MRSTARETSGVLADANYAALSDLRYGIRRFLRLSEEAARGVGLQPQQHQLMLALKGLEAGCRPASVAAVAGRLMLRHNSVVELVDRLADKGYVRRDPSLDNHREVHLSLTSRGEAILAQLSATHLAELRNAAPQLIEALEAAIHRDRLREAG